MGNTFDVQIMDSNIDEEVTRDATVLFTAWSQKKEVTTRDILPTQRLNVWRPKNY